MNSIREQVYLAALLHDIGKAYQRFDDASVEKSTRLSSRVKQLERVVCPQHPVTLAYSHKHVLWTAQFFEDIQSQLTRHTSFLADFSYDKLLRLAAAHHRPENYLEQIIQKADHYSAGADRAAAGAAGWKDAEEEADKDWDAFRSIQMRSVFDEVQLSADKKGGEAKKLPVLELMLDERFFPGMASAPDAYKTLWEKFIDELEYIQNRNLRTLGESLLFLLEKYLSRVPASTIDSPDVSLFDHLKTTAAFAISLYDYVAASDHLANQTLPSTTESPFALIGGDLSGIQQFIYSIVARGAAKNLKGRSFYLHLLVDNIVQLILDELDLPAGNVIYASGGGFYILAGNTGRLQEQVNSLQQKFAEYLFDAHGTSLYLSLDFVAFGENELFYKEGNAATTGDVWKRLSEKLSEQKARRFKPVLLSRFDDLFEPIAVSPDKKKDAITGEELNEQVVDLDKDRNLPVNLSTYQQIELGKKLKDTDYWIVSRERLDYLDEQAFEPANMGLYNYFITQKELDLKHDKLRQSADRVRVLYFNRENHLKPSHKGVDNVYGFTWYGGNQYPVNQFDEPKVFEELSGVRLAGHNWRDETRREAAPSLVRLGVLRMDVDNLGAVFVRGLPPNKRSFSRYSTLSHSLDYFFKGYLNTIWQQDESFAQYTQIIYAGGDDLFIVGKWNVLIRMAWMIRNKFTDWVCANPDLTISGGMAVVGPKFPLLKAAAYSERFEKAAKDHVHDKQGKNAFSFVSVTQYHNHSPQELIMAWNWTTEFPYLQKLKEHLRGLMASKKLAEGFPSAMYYLMQQAEFRYHPTEQRQQPHNLEVIWQVAYQFKRSGKDKDEDVKSFFHTWVKNIITSKVDELPATSYHALQLLATAARWASLEDRSKI